LNSKLHAVCDGDGKPLILLLTEGQVSDYRGAAVMLPALPAADALIADKGYDSDWFRQALADLDISTRRHRRTRATSNALAMSSLPFQPPQSQPLNLPK
jgi:transposase